MISGFSFNLKNKKVFKIINIFPDNAVCYAQFMKIICLKTLVTGHTCFATHTTLWIFWGDCNLLGDFL